MFSILDADLASPHVIYWHFALMHFAECLFQRHILDAFCREVLWLDVLAVFKQASYLRYQEVA